MGPAHRVRRINEVPHQCCYELGGRQGLFLEDVYGCLRNIKKGDEAILFIKRWCRQALLHIATQYKKGWRPGVYRVRRKGIHGYARSHRKGRMDAHGFIEKEPATYIHL
jgi:hypothetical protein